MKLFFDTETTGIANFKEPPEAACQPRLVQLGAILTDAEGTELFSINSTVKPEGFDIPEEASKVHGITTEKALKQGLPLMLVMLVFIKLRNLATTLIGHNLSFDAFVLRGELIRLSLAYEEGEKEHFCTMRESTNICQIPGPRGFKWPKLTEAYKFAFGKEFIGAHDAMADIRATKELYSWILGFKASQTQNPATCTSIRCWK